MLLTGATMIAFVHGAFGRQGWMMLSVTLFVGLGAATALAQRSLKNALTTGSFDAFQRAHRWLLGSCGILVVIGWLMEAKPF
jgi:hypothetical protein